MGTYANLTPVKFDETRYQTIGRGHGFSELDGVLFKISDKHLYQPVVMNILDKSLQLDKESWNLMYSYSFELEEKVLKNMEMKESS